MSAAVVTLIGKPDCHLCDQAREVVVPVCAEVGADFQELSVRDSPELYDQYAELIPVVLINGVQHQYWQISGVLLRQALATSMQ